MTEAYRAELVVLLRCAADIADETQIPLTMAQAYLDLSDAHFADAVRMRTMFCVAADDQCLGVKRRYLLLETAQMLEEGWMP